MANSKSVKDSRTSTKICNNKLNERELICEIGAHSTYLLHTIDFLTQEYHHRVQDSHFLWKREEIKR